MSDPSNQSNADDQGRSPGGLGDRARQFADDVRKSAEAHAEKGKSEGADRLSDVAHIVDRVADDVADQSPQMADWIRSAAREVDGVSRNLKDKSVGDLLAMGRDFARREPAAFVAASAIAGFALSRLLKSSAASASVGSGPSSTPERARSGSSGMAFHPGDAVKPSDSRPNHESGAARPAGPHDSRPAASPGTASVTTFPRDGEGRGEHAK